MKLKASCFQNNLEQTGTFSELTEDDVGYLVPGVGIDNKILRIAGIPVKMERPQLIEIAIHRAAPWTSILHREKTDKHGSKLLALSTLALSTVVPCKKKLREESVIYSSVLANNSLS